LKLTDILPLEKWIELETEINKISGLDSNVFNTDGYRITDLKNWANKLCPAIKATDKGQSFICAVAHMNLAVQAMRTKDSIIEECDAGLVKIVVPIFVKDEFLGTVGACGFLLDDGEVDSFLINKITEIDEKETEKLSEGIPSISTGKAESLATIIKEKIDDIIQGKLHLKSTTPEL